MVNQLKCSEVRILEEKLFRGLIICPTCNKKFVTIKENVSGYTYIDGTYHRSKEKCSRKAITEEEILNRVSNHCYKNSIPIIKTNAHMKQIIEKIVIFDEERYTIYFKNNKKCGWDGTTLAL